MLKNRFDSDISLMKPAVGQTWKLKNSRKGTPGAKIKITSIEGSKVVCDYTLYGMRNPHKPFVMSISNLLTKYNYDS